MKRVLIIASVLFYLLATAGIFVSQVFAQTAPTPNVPSTPSVSTPNYLPCRSNAPDAQDRYDETFCPDLDNLARSSGSNSSYLTPNDGSTGLRPYDPSVPGSRDNRRYIDCADTPDEYIADPKQNFWVEDPEVTALGRGGERSRQFLIWSLTHNSINTSPVLLSLWQISRNIAYFMLLIVAIFMGLGIIIGQRSNFDLKVNITPLVTKLIVLLVYITFSATIVLSIIQIADIMMEFFIRTLGVRELFNIFFVEEGKVTGSPFYDSERAYQQFVGCSNLNIRELDSLNTSKFLVKFTNMTYYMMGIMVILRRVVLWFLFILAPFLSVLAPFVFIRNIGWIWVGVFFQWVFYGPLMALFLGSLARIWNSDFHIPFVFDFSRVEQMGGDHTKIIFPTTTNILYGGPAQQLQTWNTSSYVDTFAEYIISLIMLWTVIILPWWLLRIFRDYCCDGIMAMKNVLIAMYDNLKGGIVPPPPGGPGVGAGPAPVGTTGMARPMPSSTSSQREREVERTKTIDTIRDIHTTSTENITHAMQISASSLTDVARFETDKTSRETVVKNMEHLANPMKAETVTERQKFMTVRNELYDRATKKDVIAERIVRAVSTSDTIRQEKTQEFLKTLPQAIPVVRTTSLKVGLPVDKTTQIVKSLFTTISNSASAVSRISHESQVNETQVKEVLKVAASHELAQVAAPAQMDTISRMARIERVKVASVVSAVEELVTTRDVPNTVVDAISVKTGARPEKVRSVVSAIVPDQNLSAATPEMVQQVATATGMPVGELTRVITVTSENLAEKEKIMQDVAQAENVDAAMVSKVAESQVVTTSKPEEHIEETVVVPPTVSLEDYEEVKTMWSDQYEKGEIPVSETIKDRVDWLETDVIAITNILNKIMSTSDDVRAEGLREIGYILPIFMINNLKGEELAVYLKAKLEAAKQVKKSIQEREKIRAEMSREEEVVEIDRPVQKTAEKTMTLEEELEIPAEESTAAPEPAQPPSEPAARQTPVSGQVEKADEEAKESSS